MATNKKFKSNSDLESQENIITNEPIQESVVEPVVEPIKPIENKISFDIWFNILCTKSGGKIQPHHKNPIKTFMQRFGNINLQTSEWFNTHMAKY